MIGYIHTKGVIPQEIGRLTSLIELDLRCNQIRGPLPVLTTLTQLQGLYLFENYIEGRIDTALALLPLSGIYLYNNCFDNVAEAREAFSAKEGVQRAQEQWRQRASTATTAAGRKANSSALRLASSPRLPPAHKITVLQKRAATTTSPTPLSSIVVGGPEQLGQEVSSDSDSSD
ncbi:hypothetical protein B484DRAFT_401176 [Ochromonadaceae sp. CCMP2298]|nr:hypothetical protein B484DRAFT_401176 [Ochromonadaceae sp. CCMP2298]